MAIRKKIEYSPEFLELKSIYPKRCGGNPWPRAFKAFTARLKQGYDLADIKAGLIRYATFCEKTGKSGSEYVLQAATFFGPDERWTEEYELPEPKIQDQFKGMSRDQQINKKAEILHLQPKLGELMHIYTARINSEWTKRYPV